MINDTHFGKTLVISPHLDDACFSIGGFLSKKELFDKITILTIFSKSIFASNLILKKVIDRIPILSDFSKNTSGSRLLFKKIVTRYLTNIRKAENKHFCNNLGANQINFEFEDSSLRGYLDLISNFNMENVETEPIYKSVYRSIEEFLCKHTYNNIFCPLGIGNHVDHLIVTKAFSQILEKDKISTLNAYFYEDLPYVSSFKTEYISLLVMKRLGARKPILIDITSEMAMKKKNINIYRSQFNKKLKGDISFHARRIFKTKLKKSSNFKFYERIWNKVL